MMIPWYSHVSQPADLEVKQTDATEQCSNLWPDADSLRPDTGYAPSNIARPPPDDDPLVLAREPERRPGGEIQ